jgi:hypothetical protein
VLGHEGELDGPMRWWSMKRAGWAAMAKPHAWWATPEGRARSQGLGARAVGGIGGLGPFLFSLLSYFLLYGLHILLFFYIQFPNLSANPKQDECISNICNKQNKICASAWCNIT